MVRGNYDNDPFENAFDTMMAPITFIDSYIDSYIDSGLVSGRDTENYNKILEYWQSPRCKLDPGKHCTKYRLSFT